MEFEKQLFSHKSEKIQIDIKLGFDKESLVLDGYDIGKTVEDYRGDSDYEYSITVKGEALEKLYQVNGLEAGQKQGLVDVLSGRINGNRSYSEFQSYLKENDIKFDSFTY